MDEFIDKSEITSIKLQVVHNCIHRRNYLRSHLVHGRSLRMMNGELMTHSLSYLCKYRAAKAAKKDKSDGNDDENGGEDHDSNYFEGDDEDNSNNGRIESN